MRQSGNELCRALFRRRDEEPVEALCCRPKRCAFHRLVVGVEAGVEILRKPGLDRLRQLTRDKNSWFRRHAGGAFGWGYPFLKSHCGERGNGLPMMSTIR